jgi:serine/alanine racemase
MVNDRDRAWIEVNLDNLRHNAIVLQEMMPEDCELMAVVKADAYGHGAERVACFLNEIGVKSFAVATIDEGIILRKAGVIGDILILGYTDLERAMELVKYRLIQTSISYDYAKSLNEAGLNIETHIKIDTGMHRMGMDKDNIERVVEIFSFKYLNISGIYTHLSVSDSGEREDIEFTQRQIDSFYKLLRELENRRVKIPKIHIQSSYGLLNYPEIKCDYARIGIALYGVLSEAGDNTKLKPDLRPVLSLKSKLALIRDIKSGEGVGYARAFIAEKDSRIGVIPIGYGDGIPRNLSCGHQCVLINGYKVPIIGRICMDQLMVDITDIPQVKIGDTVVFIGKSDDKEIPITEMAYNGNTITNELLSRMGSRLKKIYL